MSVSMTMNGACCRCSPGSCRRRGTGRAQEKLQGTIQNDILKESWSATPTSTRPGHRCGCRTTSSEYTARNMPKVQLRSRSPYHHGEAGANSVQDWRSRLPYGSNMRARMSRGLKIDEFAPRLSFFFGIGRILYGDRQSWRAGDSLGAPYGAVFAQIRRASRCACTARPRG